VYEQGNDMLKGRTLGQFVALSDEMLLVINGALLALRTRCSTLAQMLAHLGPIGTDPWHLPAQCAKG
jgi:hypothetical protein